VVGEELPDIFLHSSNEVLINGISNEFHRVRCGFHEHLFEKGFKSQTLKTWHVIAVKGSHDEITYLKVDGIKILSPYIILEIYFYSEWLIIYYILD